MNMKRGFLVTIFTSSAVCGAMALSTPAIAQPQEREGRARLVTGVSELDYLKASKERITVNLKLATMKQIFNEIGKKASFRVDFAGEFADIKLTDVSFTNQTVKEILVKLSEQLGVSYSVGRPDSLTVMAEP
jgi:hypothetical protein